MAAGVVLDAVFAPEQQAENPEQEGQGDKGTTGIIREHAGRD